MPVVREQIDRMSVSEKMQTLEYLWSSMSVAESKRRLQEAVYAR